MSARCHMPLRAACCTPSALDESLPPEDEAVGRLMKASPAVLEGSEELADAGLNDSAGPASLKSSS